MYELYLICVVISMLHYRSIEPLHVLQFKIDTKLRLLNHSPTGAADQHRRSDTATYRWGDNFRTVDTDEETDSEERAFFSPCRTCECGYHSRGEDEVQRRERLLKSSSLK